MLSLATLAAVASPAGAPGVAGPWKVTHDSDIRCDGDSITVNKRAKAELVLRQRGDSVFGTFQGRRA